MAFTINLRKSFDNVVRLSGLSWLTGCAGLRLVIIVSWLCHMQSRYSPIAPYPFRPRLTFKTYPPPAVAGGCQTLLASWRKANRMSHIKRLNIAQMSRIRHVCRWTSTRISSGNSGSSNNNNHEASNWHWQLINPALGRIQWVWAASTPESCQVRLVYISIWPASLPFIAQTLAY